MADNVPKFSFLPLAKTFDSLDGKENQENFLKWSMKDRIKAKLFSFDQSFQAYEKDKLAQGREDFSDIGCPPENVRQFSLSNANLEPLAIDSLLPYLISFAFFIKIKNEDKLKECAGHILTIKLNLMNLASCYEMARTSRCYLS
ncbi:hypothetical protein RRG08_008858 [Elysia crispata]|uniref:Uncharacterized protein n=1 Tax=Elysia crispata TaxID=231223 RepID=A0AAE1AAN4_9GAST|nr:hypothetical protein RRG08_008858 [Elysia crispata]